MNNNGDETAPPAAATPVEDRAVGRGLALLALGAVVAVAIAGAVWVARIYLPAQARVADALASGDRSLTSLGGEQRAASTRIDALDGAQRELTARVDAAVARLAQLETARTTADQAVLVELRWRRIDQLISIAEDSLRFMHDPVRAASAIMAAGAVLRESPQPREAALATALQADEAALRAVLPPDLNALAAQWTTAELSVGALRWRADTAVTPVDTPHPPVSGWREALAAFWHDLLGLVEIHDETTADAVLLDPTREALIRDSVRLELATLRWATITRDTAAVRASAASLGHTLRTYFDPAHAPVAALLQQLTGIATTDLAPPLPDVSASRAALGALRAAGVVEGTQGSM
jgi:uncharacterized protein HemX